MAKKQVKEKTNLIQLVLTLLLVGAAFTIGIMWTEIKGLKGGSNPTAKQGAAPGKESEELSDEVWQELLENSAGAKGNDEAEVVIVEFTDYECSFCQRYVNDAFAQINKEYIETNLVSYKIRDLPLPFHKNAKLAAESARCAADQNKYWEMHDKLFETQKLWTGVEAVALFKGYAGSLGLNLGEFAACLDDGKHSQVVEADLKLASKAGANGTPTFFINGKMLVGAQPFAAFKALIDEELE